MDNYVTGAAIKGLREAKCLTQEELAARIHVSAKAVSKWETGRGFPDISLLEPLAEALDISVIELLSGCTIRNRNKAANMLRSRLYVCPACGNVIQATGEAVVSCCGITLPPQEAEEAEEEHPIRVEVVEDEYHVSVDHPMTKAHYLSFLMAVSDQGTQFVRLYPEGNAEARFKISGVRILYAFCNRHGLFQHRIGREKKEVLS
ncbi:MAG: helix-turn-helix domain-containing protein [Clostridia bacterium]|nr:helix-turn-helix domain-containing protein [Clostridia bacterium]